MGLDAVTRAAAAVLAAAGILAGGLLPLASSAPAAARAADCTAYNVIIGTPVIGGRTRIRASATVICAHRPRTYHARQVIQQHVRLRGRLRWMTVTAGPLDRRIPDPRRRYRLRRHCLPGTYRELLTIGGRPSDGPTRPNRKFASTPVVIRACVSAGHATNPAAAGLAAAATGKETA